MRRRYVYDPASKEVVEVGAEWAETPRSWGKLTSEGELYDGLRAPDGSDISSRKKRREYMKATGLTDPSDYQGHAGSVKDTTWDKAKASRRKHFAGEVDVSGGRRREQLGRMLYQAAHGRRP